MAAPLRKIPSTLAKVPSFKQVELFSLLFRAPDIEKTRAFYASLFEHLGNERSRTSSLKFFAGKNPKTDIEWRACSSHRALESLHLKEDPDGRTVTICSNQHAFHGSSLPLPARAVVVLRSQQLTETLSFYKKATSWVEEKHGRGPIHYSSQWGDTVVEIYPQRKFLPAPIEIVLPVEDLANSIERLKKLQFSFLQSTSASALLQDPDQRLIHLLAH